MSKENKQPGLAELSWFVAIAFAGLWVVMVPAALTAHGILRLHVARGLQFVAEFAPAVGALVVTAWNSGYSGVRAFLRQLFRAKASWRWYVLVLLMPLATQAIAFEIFCLASKITPHIADWYDWPMVLILYLPICLVQEEIGWRGFFLDRLMRRSSLLGATLCMAGVWGLWHLPTYLARSSGQLYLIFLAGILPASAWFAFVYSRTRNVLLCGLLHAALNTGLPNWLAPLPEESEAFALGVWIGLLWLATIPVFIALRKSHRFLHAMSP